MTTIKHVLDRKGHVIHSIRKGATVFDAIKQMAEHDIGSLLVMDEDDRLVGIITERHYARNVFLKGKASPTTLVEEIMRRAVVSARVEQSIEECMALMTTNGVRHLPVLDGDQLTGVVSMGDLVAATIADQAFAIEQLEHYIHG